MDVIVLNTKTFDSVYLTGVSKIEYFRDTSLYVVTLSNDSQSFDSNNHKLSIMWTK